MFEKCYAICLSFRDTWIRPVFSGVRVQFVQLHFITIVLSAWKRCWFVCTINCFEGCFYLGYFSLFISNTTSATSVAGTVYSRKISVHPRFIFHWGLRCSIFSILCTELWISVWFSSLCFSIRTLSFDLRLLITPLVSSSISVDSQPLDGRKMVEEYYTISTWTKEKT